MPPPRPHLGIESEARLAVLEALSLVDLTDDRMLASFDRIAARARSLQLPFRQAADDLGEEIVAGALTILVLGYLKRWTEGGSRALAQLVDSGVLAKLQRDDGDFDVHTLQLAVASLYPFALSRDRDRPDLQRTYFAVAGTQLLRLARWLDAHQHLPAARECAMLAAELLRRGQHSQAASAGQFALRLMDQAGKRAFLPLVPRAKYPPRVEPELPPELTEAVALGLLQQLLLSDEAASQYDDQAFDTLVAEMLADPDWVLHCPMHASAELEDALGRPMKTALTRFEMRFATPLLRRVQALCARGDPPALTARGCLDDLLWQLIESRDQLRHRRDPYLHDWFELSGAEPYAEGALFADAALCVQTIGPIMFAIVAEHADDIENWQIFERHAQSARAFLHRARSELA